MRSAYLLCHSLSFTAEIVICYTWTLMFSS